MAQVEMFAAKANSPVTELTAAITDVATTVSVLDASKLPDAPNIATIGVDETAETIKYTGKSGNTLTGVTRGFSGTAAKAWAIGVGVARYFTAYDADALRENVAEHSAELVTVNAQLADISTVLVGVSWYGAIADGNSHPLSERYATLAQAQSVYPFATSLTNEIDWCALQMALNSGNNIAVYGGLIVDQAATASRGGIKLSGNGSITLTNKNDDILRITGTELSPLDNIEIYGLEFIGNADKADITPQRAINMFWVNTVNIHDCIFKEFNCAMRLQRCNDLQVHHNKLYDIHETSDNINGYGVLYEGCKRQTTSFNQFYRVERHSIYLNGYEAAVISGNTLIGDPAYVPASGYEMPIKLTNGNGCSILNNTCRYTVGFVWLDTAFDGLLLGPEDVIISGNACENYLQNDSIVTGWIFLKGMYMKNIKVTSNTFKTAYNHAFHYTGSGNVEITNNTIDGGVQGLRVDTASTGARIKFSDNLLLNLTSGINVTNANALIYGRNNGFKNVSAVSNWNSIYPNVAVLDNYDIDSVDAKLINSGESTIDVRLGNTFRVSNTGVTNVTGLSGQGKQQKVTLYFTNGNTILKHSSTFRMKTGADVTSVVGMVKVFYQESIGNWWEI
ncbi:hypothetical protein [Paenibacillus sp. B-A-8]|uniref:hypothetical protein n=1 Tax=Paenibacillus sp. B-A-8 TaxID=3400419 RepID=UPI003B01BF74